MVSFLSIATLQKYGSDGSNESEKVIVILLKIDQLELPCPLVKEPKAPKAPIYQLSLPPETPKAGRYPVLSV